MQVLKQELSSITYSMLIEKADRKKAVQHHPAC